MAKDPKGYWSANLKLIGILLFIWAVVSFGMGIWFRPMFMHGENHGVDIGFWFATQGSILTFVFLIFFYAWRMNKIDREFGVED